MARTAGSKFAFVLLLLLQDCPRTARGENHALSYTITVIPKPRFGQPWCEVQGEVSGNKFLSYDYGSKKFQPIGPLGMKVNNTEAWKKQSEALTDLVEELRKILLDIKPEIATTSDPLPLQGRMLCQCKANGHTSGSWEFGFNGQISLLFDSENRKWTVVQPGGELLQGTLANDRYITKLLIKISNGDCSKWLEQFLKHWEKMLETTASPTTVPATAQSRATAIMPTAWIFLVPLTCSILLGLLG
uniref:MHC class I-like antigen recognition-like domain-containing protein n=1 Tax=Equus caballus TaxID=9796 RepID=A0A3Q2H841_HORSE|nr:UL16-binding protein 2 [Equus caballus]